MSFAFKRVFGKELKTLLFLAGLIFFFLSLKAVGFSRLHILGDALEGFGPLVLCLYPLTTIADVRAWQLLFARERAGQIGFGDLYNLRLAGAAVNNVTPFIDIGGEFVKADLVKSVFGLSTEEAAASVIMARTSLFFSEIAFWVLGIAMAYFYYPLPGVLRVPLIMAVATALVVITVVASIQLRVTDPRIAAFYTKDRLRFARAIGWNIVSWIAGAAEMFVMCRLLHADLTWQQAVIVEALLHAVRSASFFIPANLGAQEAGLAVLLHGLGFDPAVGVALSLFKRLRQVVWTAVGFIIWSIYRWIFSDKPLETKADVFSFDTPFDRLVHRPPAKILAGVLAKTPVHPNHVTVFSVLPAVLSGYYFMRGTFTAGLAGAFCFYLWAVLDHADGELARRTGRTSEFGKRLDDLCDTIASIVSLGGVFLGLLALSGLRHAAVWAGVYFAAHWAGVFGSMWLAEAKRGTRRAAEKEQRVDRRFIAAQKALDHLSGREPVYLLFVIVLFAYLSGPGAAAAALSILTAATVGITFGVLTACLKLRFKRSAA